MFINEHPELFETVHKNLAEALHSIESILGSTATEVNLIITQIQEVNQDTQDMAISDSQDQNAYSDKDNIYLFVLSGQKLKLNYKVKFNTNLKIFGIWYLLNDHEISIFENAVITLQLSSTLKDWGRTSNRTKMQLRRSTKKHDPKRSDNKQINLI